MKKSVVNTLMASFLLFIFFIAPKITSLAFADYNVASVAAQDPTTKKWIITWTVTRMDDKQDKFKDFHIRTKDNEKSRYKVLEKPDGWEFGINTDEGGKDSWIDFYHPTNPRAQATFKVEYDPIKTTTVKKWARWMVTKSGSPVPFRTYQGKNDVIDEPEKDEENVDSPTTVAEGHSFTDWGLIGLVLVFLALATWVFFLRRRKVIGVRS